MSHVSLKGFTMRWLMAIVALCCVIITPQVSADTCFDYSVELLDIEVQLPQLTADLAKAQADVAVWTDVVASATNVLNFWKAEVIRLQGLFYVDPDLLKEAKDNVALYARVVTDTTKSLNDAKQLVTDLSNKINQLTQRREYLIIYLQEHCVPSTTVGPAPDPLFP